MFPELNVNDNFYNFGLQFIFDTMKDITVLRCGHTIHLECLKEMEKHYR